MMKKVRRASEINREDQGSRGNAGNGAKSRRATYMLLALAAILLLGSAIESTRAALTYYSENYTAQITVSQIGVSLLENGQVVSSRDYEKNEWKTANNAGKDSANGALLQNMLKEGEKLALNKSYKEELSVKNSGSIDEYVRVRIYKYWTRKVGDNKSEKVTTLSPSLIKLNLVNEGQWIKNPDDVKATENGGEKECMELYYKGILPSKSETALFADSIKIDKIVAADAEIISDGKTIKTIYKYDGVEFHVDVEVDAVQTHNAQDAIKSAWGVDAAALGIL